MSTLSTLHRLAKEAEKAPKFHPILEHLLNRFPSGIFAEKMKADPERQQIIRDWINLTSNPDTEPRFLRMAKLLTENDD